MFKINIREYGVLDFLLQNISLLYWILVTFVAYYSFVYIAKKIYKEKEKRATTIMHLKFILYTLIFTFILVIYGVDKAWIVTSATGISLLLLLYNLLSFFVFSKYSTKKPISSLVKDETLLEELKKKGVNEGEFTYKNILYKYMSNKYYVMTIKPKSNKDTRLYDMFLILILFFFALLGMSLLLDNIILKDSMSSNVILLFAVAFVLPYLQDIKHTIRFAKNPDLKFDTYVTFLDDSGKKTSGTIIDMNTYEFILGQKFSKRNVIIPHNKAGIIYAHNEGKLFSKKYIVSKEIKYKLEDNFKVWFTEFNGIHRFLNNNREEIGVLDLVTADSFFTTEDDDHGIELKVFVKQEALENYIFFTKKLEDFIQRKADENNWGLETPKRMDLKFIDSENTIKKEDK